MQALLLPLALLLVLVLLACGSRNLPVYVAGKGSGWLTAAAAAADVVVVVVVMLGPVAGVTSEHGQRSPGGPGLSRPPPLPAAAALDQAALEPALGLVLPCSPPSWAWS